MRTKSTFAKLTSLALLVATLTIYTASRAGAAGINPAPAAAALIELAPTTEFAFGMVGVARGQTARINAVLIIDPNVRPEPVEVEFMFHDREGNLLGQSVGTVEPGQGTSFDTRGVIDPNFRTDLIASVRTLVDPNDKNPLVCTLEVIDIATGRTVLVHANPRVSVPDSPDVVP